MTDEGRMDAMRKERDRQTQLLATAIDEAIKIATPSLGPMPMINAVAGAVAFVHAKLLCSVPSGKARKELAQEMANTTKRAIREYDGKVPHSVVVNVGRLS